MELVCFEGFSMIVDTEKRHFNEYNYMKLVHVSKSSEDKSGSGLIHERFLFSTVFDPTCIIAIRFDRSEDETRKVQSYCKPHHFIILTIT